LADHNDWVIFALKIDEFSGSAKAVTILTNDRRYCASSLWRFKDQHRSIALVQRMIQDIQEWNKKHLSWGRRNGDR
jgi:hypothetical protein